ncbi:dihydrodipicolinate synthase family protein [Halogranum rubrum]|uniref:Dihydrodipicolinate synthase/n-acetylneuraminate lyase n=1 Tax=Halogranum salarium B-1 TaxID=1210908 RepID=J2ZYZ0_9EURY|nr:dihydrodipicolinate synthase family protein [Halogranum salarium]EJN58243.1 dihydrodipicolinate synthase/n-acetylneuraminate lyase [Halogranum salarium B-1]
MHGIGVPLVTPFTETGDVDDDALRELVHWVEDRGVDFLVPCGSTSEAELMTVDERAHVVDVVVEEASVPVLAGTGHPGLRETLQQTERAAESGADAALVVTPFYFPHDDATLEAYYETVADESPIPVYLYSVPPFTHVTLDPAVAGRLSAHENVHGMKDSSGNVEAFVRTRTLASDEAFDLLVGTAGVLAPTLDAGGSGGVLALANVAPEASKEMYRRHRDGDEQGARDQNAALLELNRAVTSRFGIPGLKAAMRARGAPAGYARRPHQPVSEEARDELESVVAELEEQ